MTSFIRGLDKVASKGSYVFFIVAGIICVAACILVTGSCLTRYLFSRPFGITLDLVQIAMFYITFFGAPWIFRKDSHIQVDLSKEYCSKNVLHGLELFIYCATFILSIAMLYYGTLITYDQFSRMELLYGAFEAPKYILTICIPISALLMMLISTVKFADEISMIRTGEKITEEGRAS